MTDDDGEDVEADRSEADEEPEHQHAITELKNAPATIEAMTGAG